MPSRTPVGDVALHLSGADEVVVALQPIAAGTVLDLGGGRELTVAEDIPRSHKLALTAVPTGGAPG